jgi:hypothetical protein
MPLKHPDMFKKNIVHEDCKIMRPQNIGSKRQRKTERPIMRNYIGLVLFRSELKSFIPTDVQ